MNVECFCDRCTGNLPCEAVGHDYGRNPHNATCTDCGEVNGQLLAWIGRVAKVEKRTGLDFDGARKFLALREMAVAQLKGGLRVRIGLAGITEADL